MGKSSPPQPPDPKEVAGAQTSANIAGAQANAVMGNVNQITPWGSLTYNQTGQQFIADPNGQAYWTKGDKVRSNAPTRTVSGGTSQRQTGTQRVEKYNSRTGKMEYVDSPVYKTVAAPQTELKKGWEKQTGYYIPQYTATQELDKAGQKKKSLHDKTGITLAKIGREQSDRIRGLLSSPVDLSNEATEARLFELGSARLDPRFEREQESLRTNLVNRGIRDGSDAWKSSMGSFGETRNDAYNQLLLRGRAQAAQEALTERNQPINEIAALLGGSQIQLPQFANTNMPTIPTTDVAGIEMANYGQQMGNWQQEQQRRDQLVGGLFGLGSAAIMGGGF